MSDRFQKYLDYIDNTGGAPSVEEFDEDWEPIGPMVRRDMETAGLVKVSRIAFTLRIQRV
jgi:hypothetical protein